MRSKESRLTDVYAKHIEKRLKELYKRMNDNKSSSSQRVKKITKSYYQE